MLMQTHGICIIYAHNAHIIFANMTAIVNLMTTDAYCPQKPSAIVYLILVANNS